jgi:hypothetical protein
VIIGVYRFNKGYTPMTGKTYLTRAEAAEYISGTGASITKATLQKFASVGGGPVYRLFGKKALYTPAELDAWMAEKMSEPRRSTSAAA